jgi:hypothetical protein
VAIDTGRVNTCYDAYGIAQKLGYTDPGINPRRRLSYHTAVSQRTTMPSSPPSPLEAIRFATKLIVIAFLFLLPT